MAKIAIAKKSPAQAAEIERLRKALKESEERFANVFQHYPLGLSITRLRDGVVVEINDSYTTFTGYTREEVIGRRVSELNIWANPAEREEMLAKLKKGGRINSEEHFLNTKSGEVHPVLLSAGSLNFQGEPCLLVTAVDITEFKKAEEALKESEEKFSKAFNTSAAAICITSLVDNKFLEINDSYTRFTGYSREEAIGHTAAELKLWVIDDELKNVMAILSKDGKFQNMEFRSRHKSGEIRTGLGSAELIKINGIPCRIVVIADITERKKAEEALKESEEKFSKAFRASSNAICITTMEDRRFIEANEAFSRFTGYSHEEVIGHNAAELKLWVNEEEKRKSLETLDKDGRVYNREFSSRSKSGEIRVGLSSVDLISIGGQPYRMVVITDITKRKKIEDALQESEEKFSKAFNASAIAIGITSMKTDRFVDINESFIRFTGYTREEVIGHGAAELNLWIKPEELQKWTDQLHREGRVFNQEFSSRMKSGEIRIGLGSAEVINIRGEPCRIVVIADITDRKRAEEALKCSEENFRNSLEDSPLGIRIVDNTGDTIFMNKPLLDIYGYDSFEEFKSIPVAKRFMPENYERYLRMRQRMTSGEHMASRGETSIIRKDGAVRQLEIFMKKVLWNGENLYQLIYEDVTERKKADVALGQALANLEQSNTRLGAANKELEAFSYSVSHDLRSPLRSIDGFSQALLEDYSDKLDTTGQDYLRRLRGASQKMGELIDGLLRLSRLSRSELHKELIDLGALALEIANRLRESQPEREAEFIFGRDLTAEGDPQLLRALLENLLGNAWKFTGKKPRAIIEFGCTQDGAQKTFYVKDNGAGFDMSYADKLFGAFQRLHDATDFPGTGIGLATVQRIVNRHGGTVRAEGEVGKGATFYFTLG
jgi:PAS domain S-box-containing protein